MFHSAFIGAHVIELQALLLLVAAFLVLAPHRVHQRVFRVTWVPHAVHIASGLAAFALALHLPSFGPPGTLRSLF